MGIDERRKRERATKKSALSKAARKLFFEKGFKSVTVESIARRAQVSKGSVYLYFKSKEEIYTQILFNDIDKFHQEITNLINTEASASEMLIRFSMIYIDFFLNDRELFRILMTFMLHTDDMNLGSELSTHLIKNTNRNMRIIENIFEMGIKSGEYPSSISLKHCRNVVWGLLNGVVSLYLYTGEESKREERIRQTIQEGLDVFIRGLKNSKEETKGGQSYG